MYPTPDSVHLERHFGLSVKVRINTLRHLGKNCKTFPFLAYDLTQNEGINDEHSTTVNGKGKNITREDMLTVGLRAGLSWKNCEGIFEEIHDALAGLRFVAGHGVR